MNMLLIISKRSRSYTCVRTVYEENEVMISHSNLKPTWIGNPGKRLLSNQPIKRS